jgi:putative heme-binding domain-containing protein
MEVLVERRLRMRLLLLLVLTIPAALLAQHSHTPADIQEGGRLFRANCVLCHGPEGDQVPGIDLGHGRFRQTYSENALIKIIQNGIPGTGMPPNNLQDFQAEIVVAYLRSVATSGRTVTGNGNAARGKVLFEGKANCASCHRVNGVGSRVGPDLSDIAALRRTVEIERSLLDPNEETLPQNRTYRAVTSRGDTVTGRLLNIDTFTVQILDSKERLLSLQRSDLRESGFVQDSPMPSYRDQLSSQELADIVAYLVTLKGI